MLKTALLFGDNMVLQRDKPVAIWGTATPGTEIQIRMQGKTARTTADGKGTWRVLCGPFTLSFEEQMEICAGKDRLHFHHVQVGEVYLAGGQSNMEFHMCYDQDFEEEKANCVNHNIRFFDYPEVSYPGQIDERDYRKHYGFWRRAEPEQLRRFSAVGYYFAKELQATLHVPVGVIGCNWGGTPATAWMSTEAICEGGGRILLEEYQEAVRTLDLEAYESWFQKDAASWRVDQLDNPINDVLMLGGTEEELIKNFAAIGLDMSNVSPEDFKPLIGPKHERRPSGLYESMLCQVAPYTIRGILWYQGETDGDTHPELYDTLFPALIRNWRSLWGEELPFLFVQIAPLDRWLDCVGKNYVAIRKAQQHVADSVPGTGMAVITDVGEKNDIHPKNKRPVGHRLALLAENRIYGIPVVCEAPRLISAQLREGQLTLFFAHAENGLHLTKNDLNWLEVVQNGVRIEQMSIVAETKENQLILTCSGIHARKKTIVKLAQTGWYQVNLYNTAGIPACPAEIQLCEEQL